MNYYLKIKENVRRLEHVVRPLVSPPDSTNVFNYFSKKYVVIGETSLCLCNHGQPHNLALYNSLLLNFQIRTNLMLDYRGNLFRLFARLPLRIFFAHLASFCAQLS